MDPTPAAAPAVAPEPTPGTSSTPSSVYTRLGPPADNSADTAGSLRTSGFPDLWSLCLSFRPWPRF